MEKQVLINGVRFADMSRSGAGRVIVIQWNMLQGNKHPVGLKRGTAISKSANITTALGGYNNQVALIVMSY